VVGSAEGASKDYVEAAKDVGDVGMVVGDSSKENNHREAVAVHRVPNVVADATNQNKVAAVIDRDLKMMTLMKFF
jgi:hypothetical protein